MENFEEPERICHECSAALDDEYDYSCAECGQLGLRRSLRDLPRMRLYSLLVVHDTALEGTPRFANGEPFDR